MSFQIVTSLPEASWRSFVDQHAAGNIFHTPEMFHVFQRVPHTTPQIWAALDDQGQIQALLPLVKVALRAGLLGPLTTRAIAYGGALAAPGTAGRAAFACLLEGYIQAAARQAVFTELRHLADVSSLAPLLRQAGFGHEEHLDYLVDLNLTPEEVLHNIGPRTRKHIRSGLRKGNVVIETLTQKEHLADWYGVIQKTYLAARVPLADYALFEAAFDHLHAGGMIKFWLARLGDAYVAASVELLYKQTMYGWYGGVDRAYSREVPGELIMWHILKWGAENGYHVYDFGGAGKPDQEYGVRDFKAKFGGNLVDYGRDLYIPNPALLRVSTLGYQIYQKLLSRP